MGLRQDMKILVFNRGSSSLKCVLYDFKQAPNDPVIPLWQAHVEWKRSFTEPRLTVTNESGVKYSKSSSSKTAEEALKDLMLPLDEIDVIGHRIVHGGNYFNKITPINSEVKEKIRILSEIAPLHNLAELECIEITEKLFKDVPQFAVFDTSFHHSLPKATKIYPGSYKWYEEGIQKFGFHGISFQYCCKRAAKVLNKNISSLKMVICHLGSGASLCAIKDGKSMDTTMGFTPLEGLMMDSRSGSIDPGIILYLLEKQKKSLQEISKEMYQESGLLGISGISSDMRDIIEKSLAGNVRAGLALDMYIHRLNSSIGSMVASLKGLDVLVFTAGIGENSSLIRERVCDTFSFLGVDLDGVKNAGSDLEDRELSTKKSNIKVLLIYTQEAFEIASECWRTI